MRKDKISLIEYQSFVEDPWVRSEDPKDDFTRIVLGITEETGEVFGKVKKAFRDDWSAEKLHDELGQEIGDAMFYWAKFCNWFDLDLDRILVQNVEKLEDRKDRDMIHGEGDSR